MRQGDPGVTSAAHAPTIGKMKAARYPKPARLSMADAATCATRNDRGPAHHSRCTIRARIVPGLARISARIASASATAPSASSTT